MDDIAPPGSARQRWKRRLDARGLQPKAFVDAHVRTAEEDWVPQNGARVVAKAGPIRRSAAPPLRTGREAVTELGGPLAAGAPPPPRRAREHG